MPHSPFIVKEGFLDIPKGPGLGIDVNETFIEQQAMIGHHWRAPTWRHEDELISEW